MLSLGLDIGYSAVKIAILDEKDKILYSDYRFHKGDVRGTLVRMLESVFEVCYGRTLAFGAATGSGAGILCAGGVNGAEPAMGRVNEVTAVVEGTLNLFPAAGSVVEIGGQSAKYVTGLDPEDKSKVKVAINPNCSSGTGSFLEEQVSRLGVDIEDYSQMAARAGFIPRIAGRCSVFAKTDITHHQQEGVGVDDILAGLAYAVARNYRGAVMRRLPRRTPIFFAGGVAQNQAISKALRDILKLGHDEFVLSPHSPVASAAGAAILAREQKMILDTDRLMSALEHGKAARPAAGTGGLKPLSEFEKDDNQEKHYVPAFAFEHPEDCWLGIDVGSTSTNLVLADEDNQVLAYKYLRTRGNPVGAVREGLELLKEESKGNAIVRGVAVTGSGRYMIGRLVGADVVKDEITAQARAAMFLDPQVDTVFEIGGQDSKFISIDNGVVVDFQMNKICAAGTGSFIEEQALKLGIPLEKFSPLAFESQAPLDLGARCTVFMETSIASCLGQGAELEDIAAGLSYSIVSNYMDRVVGRKKIGDRIFFQGGVAYNRAVVSAFRAATGKEVRVPEFFSVTGALGAAILAREEMETGRTAFKGFDLGPDADIRKTEKDLEPAIDPDSKFNRSVADFVFQDYDPSIDPDKKTVGIPRALFTYGMFPMFYPFFKALGFNVVMSESTSENTIALAQEYSLDETCYPVKLINGHAAELVNKGVDYLFFPDLFTVFHPDSKSRQNYGCAYMQMAFKIIRQAMDLDKKGIQLVAPTIAFSLGQDFMRSGFMRVGEMMGKSPQETGMAMQAAMKSYQGFEARMQKAGKEALAGLDENKKTFVIISKIYGVADPVLNMGIPDKLMRMGHQAVPFYNMPEADIFDIHPNMYWPFGQHILEAARLVREKPNFYAVLLTHHGCGPDTVFTHYVKDIMGTKPYLSVEVDEHSSSVGVITRVEAFVESLKHYRDKQEQPALKGPMDHAFSKDLVREGETVFLPDMYPYSQVAAGILNQKGIQAGVLGPATAASLAMGRKYSMTNEYFSMAALLGDALFLADKVSGNGTKPVLLIPQNEGAEVDGQYSRYVRQKLDDSGFPGVRVLSPYMEDMLKLPEEDLSTAFLGLLAGDLVLLAPPESRPEVLDLVLAMTHNNGLDLDSVLSLAKQVREMAAPSGGKKVLAVGEPLVVFNSVLNNRTYERVEKAGHRVVFAPFSEYMWCLWKESSLNNRSDEAEARLDRLAAMACAVSGALGDQSHFAPSPDDLFRMGNETMGLYSGSFGRYRQVKCLGRIPGVKGVISACSMYENTGITLGVLHKSFAGEDSLPVLNLTFDGNSNDNDRMKVDSFLYYI